jgi:hypothetical protein
MMMMMMKDFQLVRGQYIEDQVVVLNDTLAM